MSLKFALWASAAGALIPVMAVLNARLGEHIDEPLHASFILFIVGCLCCGALALLATGSLPDPSVLTKANPAYLLGGFIVAFYVVSATLVAPRFGVANFILFAVVAQITVSVVIDHLGLFGMTSRPNDVAVRGIDTKVKVRVHEHPNQTLARGIRFRAGCQWRSARTARAGSWCSW